ncbi:hypothetical protein Ga0061079_1314 [Apibacter mensalis]|uniref:Uncharacterized protein n=1 Tax=Apibacter mensalis TaxID=1586267 RepID=A0A0X3AS79_9FLAO|nr:hypothetical protein [Apibacter mensalis]CVK17246.1 hypothetical protein Ga0061079_1314 [Apibacter mensalis]
MNTKKINKLEEKVAEILGIYKGGAYEEDGCIFLKTHVVKELDHKQLKKLMELGRITLKRSGNGTTIIIKILD